MSSTRIYVPRDSAALAVGADEVAAALQIVARPGDDGALLQIAQQTREAKETGKPAPKARPRLAPGTRLIRDWHGRTHTIDVLDGGFRYEEATYKSLSEIARLITGARWSGPRFFGVE